MFLKNWRPLSLLNTDYKILAKVLAKRLEVILPLIIDDDQTGYIKSRYIGQNIRTIEDIISFTETYQLPGIILSVDFAKAFDTLNWHFIDVALQKFNIGTNMRKWISVMYHNIESAVINNGTITPWFYLERGVRQGCPMSAFLFIISVELLALKIRQDPNISGIKIKDGEVKISQLADDTTCFISDINSLKSVIEVFHSFYNCAGLQLNKSKTKAKYIGTLKGRTHFPFDLAWTNENIQSLGIIFTENEKDSYTLNFEPRISKMKQTLQVWKQRHLSLKGKVTVINNLALAPLIYIASAIAVPERVINEVNSIVYEFLWDSRKSKIAKNVII